MNKMASVLINLTKTILSILGSIIRNRLAQDMITFTAVIGLQKTFDCVNRDFLMNKILAYVVVFLAMRSLYINTQACLKLPGGLFTNWFNTSFEVKQGDNLSSTPFSAFLNSLATGIKKLNAGQHCSTSPNRKELNIFHINNNRLF